MPKSADPEAPAPGAGAPSDAPVTTRAAAPLEVELKLALDPSSIWRLQRHPALRGSIVRRPVASEILSIYYDTPEFDLRRKGIALRLRRAGDKWVQTVKCAGSVVGGLHRRPEWEHPTSENTLDFSLVDDPEVRALFSDPELQRALYPVFTTTFHRSARLIEFAGGDCVEFCIDRGEIVAHGRSDPICEVEIELRRGNAARLFTLALELQRDVRLWPEARSKAQRGYALAAEAVPTPVRAVPSELGRRDSVHAAVSQSLQQCLAHLQANRAGVLTGTDPEYIHQARVALRRMRSMLGLFAATLPITGIDSLRNELRWLAAELEDARNWHVFRAEWIAPLREAFPAETGVGWLDDEVGRRVEKGVQRARAAVDSARADRMQLELGALAASPSWALVANAAAVQLLEQPLAGFARGALRRRHKSVRKRGDALAALDDEGRHALRIAAKKLRYAAEFFTPLFSGRRARNYLRTLEHVQDVLGRLNDIATAESLLHELPPPEGSTQAAAIALLRGMLRGHARADLEQLPAHWQGFADASAFWEK